jgi:hypothetical protein
MTALQSIIKEAKSLRAKYPKRFTKWTDYVKQASAIYSAKHKGKSPVGKKKVVKKKVAKKKIGATKKIVKRKVAKKKAAKKSIAKKPTEKVILKKVHSAKTTSKNLFNKLDKLDEAQHKHMMGKMGALNMQTLKDYQEVLKKINIYEKELFHHKLFLKNKAQSLENKYYIKKQIISIKKYLLELKKQKTELKKLL